MNKTNTATKRVGLPGLVGGSSSKYPLVCPKHQKGTLCFMQPSNDWAGSSSVIKFDKQFGEKEAVR